VLPTSTRDPSRRHDDALRPAKMARRRKECWKAAISLRCLTGPGIELPAAVMVPRPIGRPPVSCPGSPSPKSPAAGSWKPGQAEPSAGQLQCLVGQRARLLAK